MATDHPTIPLSYYRGGTSKALFFHDKDLPPPGDARNKLFIRLMGSPDPMQIDGMGGTYIVTSKIAVVKPSTRPDADVDYTFYQISVESNEISDNANCGNISAAVGPFAITEGLIKNFRKGASVDPHITSQEVRIFNTGTQKVLVSHVPIKDSGHVQESGDYSIAGCPGTGAPLLMDYKGTIGAYMGHGLLPTGSPIDQFEVSGKTVECTFCDVANPVVFVRASDMGIDGSETPAALDKNSEVLGKIKELRGRVAQKLGKCQNWERVDEEAGALPLVALVSKPTSPDADIQSRLFLDNKTHTSMAGTGAICHTACSAVPGSIIDQLKRSGCSDNTMFNIQHPSGIMPVAVTTKPRKSDELPEFETLSFIRTARRFLKGDIDVPDNVVDVFEKGMESLKSAGVNGVHSEKPDGSSADPGQGGSPTTAFADFVAAFQHSSVTSEVSQKLKRLLLDYIGVAAAATENSDSAPAFLKALQTMSSGMQGDCTVICQGSTYPPRLAALFNGATAHSLDFDDTYAPGALHPGVVIISATFAEFECNPDYTAADFITALAVGYETNCRLANAMGTGGYAKGFHNTATMGIFGAVAAIAKLRKLDAKIIENAFGLALSKAAGSMQYLENGSWNKRLHAGFAASDALLAITLAESGVVGSAKAFEGKYGLLNLYGSGADVSRLRVEDLGQRWEFLETATKPYPACRMTHGHIEMAANFLAESKGRKVKEIHAGLSNATFPVVGIPQGNKIHPSTVVDAQFSSYYQIAVAILYGDALGWEAYAKRQSADVIEISDKITITADDKLNGLESWLQVTWDDDTVDRKECMSPKGEEDRPISLEDVVKKFESLALPIYGEDVVSEVQLHVKDMEDASVRNLIKTLGQGATKRV